MLLHIAKIQGSKIQIIFIQIVKFDNRSPANKARLRFFLLNIKYTYDRLKYIFFCPYFVIHNYCRLILSINT